MDNLRPSKKEKKALTLFYDRFYMLYDEMLKDDFIKKSPEYRLLKIREVFSVFKEISNYEPIRHYISWMKDGGRPVFDWLITNGLLGFIRNLLSHFPLFDCWDDVYIDKDLATWSGKSGSIDSFLARCDRFRIDNKPIVKYRIWEYEKKKMTYFSVNFSNKYTDGEKVFLRDILEEYVGIKFCLSMMKNIVDIAIENPIPSRIDVMSQVYIPFMHKPPKPTD